MPSDAFRSPAVDRLPAGVGLNQPLSREQAEILSPVALAFVADLERRFRTRRASLLARRVERQAQFDAGQLPDFLTGTAEIREGDWTVGKVPADLQDRRVEITGPVERKMIINALNSGAKVFMADFEDSCSPTWKNLLDGQRNLRDAVRRRIDFTHPETGKRYALAKNTATLVVRPRGWHLDETHMSLDGRPVSASIFDFALFLFHNAHELIARGKGPYFYLPKLESHLEARLWNDIIIAAQEALGLPRGTVKVTVLIETLPAAFEMDEILYELRDHIAGLNCGRWDYIFSFIKTTRAHPDCVLPDRGSVGMDRHFLRSYSRLLIQTCHRRGAHAMGGMAAQIPVRGDEELNAAAIAKVREDKHREVTDGHDGTWVAHPGLVQAARDEFDLFLTGPHQINTPREPIQIQAEDLLRVPEGTVTLAGVRQNLSVGIRYIAAWLAGNGCVPIDGLMEDAATAEISRSQLWQWRQHAAELEQGQRVDAALLQGELDALLEDLRSSLGDIAFTGGRFALAGELFAQQILAPELGSFLTLDAYPHLKG
jgi:malate synthase